MGERQARARNQPRNRIPWAIMAVAWVMAGVTLLVIRWYLADENAKRDREQHDKTYDDVYIADEANSEKKVDKVRSVCGRCERSKLGD